MYITGGIFKKKKIITLNNKLLRPTTSLIRKIIFFWLNDLLKKKFFLNILDCYSGSGILTFETISRYFYIKNITLIEYQKKIIRNLYKNIKNLNINLNIKIIKKNTLFYLKKKNKDPYNLIFIDPPYKFNILEKTINLLNNNNWIDKKAIIYLSYDKKKKIKKIPINWKIYKQKITKNSIHTIYIYN